MKKSGKFSENPVGPEGDAVDPGLAQSLAELQSNVIQFLSLAQNARYHLTSNETVSIL